MPESKGSGERKREKRKRKRDRGNEGLVSRPTPERVIDCLPEKKQTREEKW